MLVVARIVAVELVGLLIDNGLVDHGVGALGCLLDGSGHGEDVDRRLASLDDSALSFLLASLAAV